MSFDLILPHVEPLAPLLDDPEVSEIMVNPGGKVFVEVNGMVAPMNSITMSEERLNIACRKIARALGDDISEEHPLLNARLPDGSRVSAVLSGVCVGGSCLTIRKFRHRIFNVEELVERKMLSREKLGFLKMCIQDKRNILISGGTGTGKTTLLNALAGLIPSNDRIVLIEDTAEISLAHDNMLRLEARRGHAGMSAVTIRDLLRHTLRLRPDRIVLGEVRDAAAFDLLQALNTGHRGSLSTIHANGAYESLGRFQTLIAMSGEQLPYDVVAKNVADAIQVLVHINRAESGFRNVTEILRVIDYDLAIKAFRVEEVEFAANYA